MDYDYGKKRQWRRWVWNRIAERTIDRANANCMFLAGDEGFDISYASLKGFRANNMIAVEKSKDALQSLRSKGILAVDGELCDVIEAWPDDRKVDVVVADFCCGLELNLLGRLAEIYMMRAFCDATFVFNFQRGRDQSITPLRKTLIDGGESVMHRGQLFWWMAMSMTLRGLGNPDEQRQKAFWDLMDKYASPVFYSYKSASNRLTFDTVVFKSPTVRLMSASKSWPLPLQKRAHSPEMAGQRRRIAAVLAHQTRRMA